MRTHFVALAGFALAVASSAGLGIASGSQGDNPPIPDEVCDYSRGEDTSGARVEVAGPDGEALLDAQGKPHTVPACPGLPSPPGSNVDNHGANCKVETNRRGQRGETCDVVECRFDVNAQKELVEVCESPSKRPDD